MLDDYFIHRLMLSERADDVADIVERMAIGLDRLAWSPPTEDAREKLISILDGLDLFLDPYEDNALITIARRRTHTIARLRRQGSLSLRRIDGD